MKLNIPENLKSDLPQNSWGKILGATPVDMTVVATLLAGLASSEMTRAQYDRSLAAQLQSKAGDQWSFFQAKKLRAALQHTTLDLMSGSASVRPLDPKALSTALAGTPAAAELSSPAGQQTLEILAGGEMPKAGPASQADPAVKAALASLEAQRPEAEITPILAKLSPNKLEEGLRGAQARSLAFDAVTKPVSRMLDLIDKNLASSGSGAEIRRDFVAARLEANARRYDIEASLNQAVAGYYELQVRKENLSAERHHRRSQKFFYGMLGAQMGVIISTLAMAARNRSLLWSLAAAAGSAAIVFALYVYLWV